MNERIREIAKDCGYQHIPFTSLGKVGDFDYFDIERFAELIVRNCIEQAHSVGDLRGVNDDMIYGADYAAVQISKYFGVE